MATIEGVYKLLKEKPKNLVQELEKINLKGARLAGETGGYKSFKFIDPYTLKPYQFGVDMAKTIDPLGILEGKTIKEIRNLSPVDRYFFEKNRKAVLAAQRKTAPTKKIKELKAKIKGYATQGRNTLQNLFNKLPRETKLFRMVPAAGAAAIDFGVFAGLLGTPIDEAIVGASGWLTKRPELGKALGTIATQYSEGKITFAELREKSLPILKEIAKEQFPESKLPPVAEEINEKMGEGTIKIADDIPEPESSKRRRMFEEANERFGDTNELEISDIDNPFMAAMGGRVGFKDGSPDPMEEMATLKQAIAAVRSPEVTDQFLYDTSPVGKLEKNLLGKDGDRTLMQSFNTQFLDPRTYPYYAQRLLRGAANIPEFIFSTPKAGLAFIQDLRQNAGITKEGVEEILEILDPSITRDFLNGEFGDLLGLSDKAIQASEEKRTGPQRTTGEFLQVAGELPGPATPIFLLGYAPKLLKQLGSLGATGSTAIDKINKEIENKVAQQGVDQTRRDIVLSIGAGGAVAFLKYLGLDFLSKAPRAVEKVAPTITKGGTPKYFFDFVSLIRSKGKDITDKASTLERQKVYDYNGYTMYEDISTGKISIRKDTEGGATYSVGDGEYETVEGIVKKEEINYEPPETILDDKGKPKEVPDSYDEATLRPDAEGDLDDIDSGLDSIDEILDLLAKDGKKYTYKELSDMGLNLEGLGKDRLQKILKDPEFVDKIFKAGGGIVKLAGADSGPPPKSGPTPHGLPYVAKNVRPIKERK